MWLSGYSISSFTCQKNYCTRQSWRALIGYSYLLYFLNFRQELLWATWDRWTTYTIRSRLLCCSWSDLFRWHQHCWARTRRKAEHQQTLQLAPTDRLHATPAPSFPIHTEAQRLVVAPWLRIKWNLSRATNMARVPAHLHLRGNFCADIVKGMHHGRLILNLASETDIRADCFRFLCWTNSLIIVSWTR